jgi:hypothetical protein
MIVRRSRIMTARIALDYRVEIMVCSRLFCRVFISQPFAS